MFTHRRPADTAGRCARWSRAAAQAGVTLRLDEEETHKHAGASSPVPAWS